jgi:hypothetical protein
VSILALPVALGLAATELSFLRFVGFEDLTAVSTKVAVFWVVAPYSLVEVYQRFRGPCCLHHQGDEKPTRLQTTRRYKPEDSHRISSSVFIILF